MPLREIAGSVSKSNRPLRLGKRRLIAEDASLGGLHQPGGEIDHVADHRVFAAAAVADDPAKHSAARHADGTPPAQLREAGPDVERREHAAERIVFMGQRRQAHRRHEGDAFVVRAQLVDAALVAVQPRLQGLHHLLRRGERRLMIEVGQADEQHRQPAKLPQPVRMPHVEPLVNRRGNIAENFGLGGRIEFGNLLRLERWIRLHLLQPHLATWHR